MQLAIDILSVELKEDQNFNNYLLKYDTCTFQLHANTYSGLHNICVEVFKERMNRYPTGDSEKYGALVINNVIYLRYMRVMVPIREQKFETSKIATTKIDCNTRTQKN